MSLYPVEKYRNNCPESWERAGFFMALHDVEAMWMSFSSGGRPIAALIGAGGINALTGEKLGTVLAKENYVVVPPQPWLDGWKDQDGTVYQFIATPHQKGAGITVGEQLLGAESKTGALGIAVFEPKASTLKDYDKPKEWNTPSPSGPGPIYKPKLGASEAERSGAAILTRPRPALSAKMSAQPSHPQSREIKFRSFAEMGIGKGGKIIQKIYPDPYGLEVWKQKPSAVFAFYLVDAATAEEITGEKIPAPSVHSDYKGPWYGLHDKGLGDLEGSDKFTALQSAAAVNSEVFPGDTSNTEKEAQPVVVSDD